VSASEGIPASIRLFEPLFTVDDPDANTEEYEALINANSVTTQQGFVEKSLAEADSEQRFQFEREGYFCIDSKLSSQDNLVFNRVVGLRDTWAKIEKATT
jgi:glutaminyl-tRNA synthetase